MRRHHLQHHKQQIQTTAEDIQIIPPLAEDINVEIEDLQDIKAEHMEIIPSLAEGDSQHTQAFFDALMLRSTTHF